MPSYDPNFFNVSPYYDDFDEDKRFLKMLFRPGYALQARELSQIQSILQNQIERFGNFVLDDGSMVVGGQITEIPANVVAITGLTGGGGVKIGGLNDKVVSLFASGTTSYAKIIHGTKNPVTNEDVIYYQYMSGTTASGSLAIQGFNTGITFNASTSGSSVNGLVVFVDRGIRYTNGYFVSHDAQRIGVYQNDISSVDFSTPNSSVGFNVNKSIITNQDDISLRDPASGFYNFNAPGSDRFKIELEIAQRALTASVDTSSSDPLSRTDFIEFIRVVDGNVIKKEKYPDLGQIEETFARRTYDESGHYIVDPFEITMIPGPTATQLTSKLDSGKAYVFGYEFETIGSSKLNHDKSREFSSGEDIQYGYSVGPFILAKFSNLTGGASGFNISQNPLVLFDSSNGLTTSQSTEVDGVRFVVGEYATTNVFIPGATLYFGSNEASLTTGAGASAHITARILRVVGTSTEFTTIEIGPPYAIGNGWTGGFTSSFANTSPFYVAAGPSYEAGTNLNTYTGSNVSFFNTISAYSFTGGSISSQIGSARVRNIQKLSGDTHKLFLDQVSMNPGKSLSQMNRIFVSGNTGNPAFFAVEVPTNTYNVSNTSLVFESPFAEVVREFVDYDFMVDVAVSASFSSGSWALNPLSFSGLRQIGPNIPSSEIFYDLNSSQIVSAYCDHGKIEGEVRINGGTDPKTITIQNARLKGSTYTGPATVVISCLVNGQKRTKTASTASSLNLSFEGPDSQGYYYSYLNNSGTILTDVYDVSITPALTGFIFDDGQRETYYDFARIKFPSLPSGSHSASVSYYSHSGVGPFWGGGNGSYPNFLTIPTFIDGSGRTVSLRNSLDFRPTRIGATGSFSLTGPFSYSSFVSDGYEHRVDYSYYLPRIDKIILTRDKQFQVIKGIPSESPIAPADNPNAMTLYTIRFNPYTFDENDVSIIQEDNRRFTMKDIGGLERRIEKLEYYSTLSLLEQEAKNSPIYDDRGLELSKKAMLVDQFTGMEASDVENPDFFCSVNREKRELRPPLDLTNVGYETNFTITSGLTSNDGVVMMNYIEEEFLSNKKYNSTRKINSNSIVDFNGMLKLTPHCDPWFSVTKAPIIKANLEGENDSWLVGTSSFSMNSDFWDYNWFGKNPGSSKVGRKNVSLTKNYKSRPLKIGKIGNFTLPQSSISSTPDKVIDSSLVPYARSKTISLNATGLIPNKLHYIYFEDELKASGITSSSKGELSYSLTISGDAHPAGRKLVRVTDSPNGALSTSTSSADALYTVSGSVKDADSIRFTRPLITRREASNSENVVNDVLTRDFQRRNVKSKSSKENLSQMFAVNKNDYSLGLFVSSVQVYFSAWPTGSFEKNIPVRLMLKPVVNGFPSPSKVISEAVVYDIQTDPGEENAGEGYKLVKFKFPYPQHLEPGEYAIELETNSSEYAVKTYSLPSVSTTNGDERESVIDSSFGSFILPKNLGDTKKLTNEFLSLVINKCDFGDSGSNESVTYEGISVNYPSELRAHLEGSLLDSRYSSVSCGGSDYLANSTQVLKDIPTLSTISVNLKSISKHVSPCYDTRASNLVVTKYKMTTDSSSTNELKASDASSPSDLDYRNLLSSRYITKTVNTLQGARNVSVVFDKNQPPGTIIKVYLKRIGPNSTTKFDDAPYIELVGNSDEVGVMTTDEFVKTEYRHPVDLPEFNTFAVKVVFMSPSNTNKYPSIKNLRVVAI